MGNQGKPVSLAVWLGALSLLTTLACADPISREELLRDIEAGARPRILDVRSEGEYAEAHVPGAVRIPFYSLLGNLERLPQAASEDDPLVVYCEHGPRAGLARAQLWLAGAGPVLFLEGHMSAWKQDGLPTESEPGQPGVSER